MLISVALLGLLAALDPLRPVVFVLVLHSERPRVNAIAVLVGWALALAVLFFAGFLAFDAGAAGHSSSAQKTWLSTGEVLLGVVLLVLAARRWRRRHQPSVQRRTPQAILRQVARLTPRPSSLLGVLIQPRMLTVAAALVVARDRSGPVSITIGISLNFIDRHCAHGE